MCYSAIQGYGNEVNGRLKETFYPKMFPFLLFQLKDIFARINAMNTTYLSEHPACGPFLTIGIANYNYARYLPYAFRQIRKQNFSDFEILYCDDGSEDNSISIIRGFIASYPDIPIRLIEGKNEGIIANRNRILESARGKYLMICDADDHMLDGCLEALCHAAIQNRADCVIGGFVESNEAGRILKKHIPEPDACKWLYTWHHAQIYKVDIIRKNQIRFTEQPDDVLFLQKVHLYSSRTTFVSRPLYVWMRHADSVSSDTQKHTDWHPCIIWNTLSDFIGVLRTSVAGKYDKQALLYYLYKWFYLNICDLSNTENKYSASAICSMQFQMEKVVPGYRNLTSLLRALRTRDTLFARAAVLGCWFLETVGLLPVLVWARWVQNTFRKRKKHERVERIIHM